MLPSNLYPKNLMIKLNIQNRKFFNNWIKISIDFANMFILLNMIRLRISKISLYLQRIITLFLLKFVRLLRRGNLYNKLILLSLKRLWKLFNFWGKRSIL